MSQEIFENMFLKIREENSTNKITLKYGAEEVTFDEEANIKIKNGWLRYINLNDSTIRYINIDTIYEIELNKD